MMGRFFYTMGIYLLGLVIKAIAIFKPQVKKWVEGRKNWEEKLALQISHCIKKGERPVWLHAASTGEFEQGKPVLEALKAQNPDIKIIVSFFSPSGFDASKKYSLADLICYLPLDTPTQAKRFIEIINPKLVLWVKYEYWWNHLATLKSKQIPVLLVSAILQPRHPITRWYGGWYRKMLAIFSHVFVQDQGTAQILSAFVNPENLTIAGDTRFDRVLAITQKWKPIPLVEQWIGGSNKVIIAGSTWLDDVKLLSGPMKRLEGVKWILVPHKIDEGSIAQSLELISDYLKFSDLEKNNELLNKDVNVLVLDAMGYLSRLYSYATICYIGGGFTPTGIHNSLEAAVYSKPLVWGPRYDRYVEAMALIEVQGAFSVKEGPQLDAVINALLSDKAAYEKAAYAAGEYVMKNAGATQKVLGHIYKNRLLTSE